MNQKYYNLTNPQKSIWYTEQVYKGNNLGNICGTMLIHENVDTELLKETINSFIKKNDAMRTRIVLKDGVPLQYISGEILSKVEVINLKNLEELHKVEKEIHNYNFNLLNSELFIFKIFKLADGSGGIISVLHHLISDAWSFALMSKELKNIYEKLLSKEQPTTDNNNSYVEYIQDEKKYLESDKYIKDKDFWENRFQTVSDLATIKPYKNSSINTEACRYSVELPKELCEKINTYVRNNNSSVYNFIISIFSIYLAKVSNIDNIVVGTPFLNRTNYKEKNIIGMFVNTLPNLLRINLDLNFKDFLKYTTTEQKNMFRHSRYPYDALLEKVRKEQNINRNLYDISISYQNARNDSQVSNIKYSTYWTFAGTISDSLQINVFDMDNTGILQILYDYQTIKFDESEIMDLHNRILYIIKQVLENEIYLKDIEIVTPEEKNKLLCEFNNTNAAYPLNKTIVDLFEYQVNKAPNNTAIVFDCQKISYKELNNRANKLASKILYQNIKNKYITIICDKNIEMIISILAILKTGNCYIPIDPNSPENRIDYIINTTNSSLMLTTKNYKEKYSKYNLICVDDTTNFSGSDNELLENINKSSADDSAYIIFTSGTTGNPKGVEVLHKSIVNTLFWRKNCYNFNSTFVTLQIPSFAFDSSVEDIFTTLISGGSLVLPLNRINDVNSLINDIITNKVTHFLITPALYNIFLESDCSKISTLKYITVAGEAFSIDLVEKHFSVFPNTRLFNEYGPTENSVCSTVYEFSKNSKAVYIGQPIDNVKAYILSKNGTLLPIGIPGELCFSGRGLSKGYFKSEDLTNEKFIDNPFTHEKMYKTGDIARWLPDGNIEFIERIDNQVKIRGYRIELSEIDNKILEDEIGVSQSVTILNNINNAKFICSYITAEKNINVNELKSNLRKSLPSYMIPSFITQLDSIPLNINGKVDRKKLPTPNINKEKEIILPRNTTDEKIISLIKEILYLEKISIIDSFFDLGGDSLSAITFSNKISKNFNINTSVQDIFKYPIIQDLSDYINKNKNSSLNIKIKPAEKLDYYPLSSAQKRIYYASIIDNNSTLYNTPGGIIVNKLLDKNKLENCFFKLIKRHDALRTHFDIKGTEVVQIIQNNIDFHFDVETSSRENISKIFDDFIKPFDLSKAPLYRVKIVNLDNNEMLLLLDMHHIINDGASSTILLQELCDLYNDKELSEKTIDYKDFTLWEKEQFKTDSFKEAKNFWIEQYKNDVPLLNMPLTFPRPSVQSFEGSNYYTTLSKDVFEQIHKVAKELGITPYMLMLSCFYILLSRYSSQECIIVGTPVIARQIPELTNIIGMFVNTLALKNTVDSSLNFDTFASQIKDYCLSAFKYQYYPFDDLVKQLNLKRENNRNPLFDTMFIYQNNGLPKIDFNDATIEYCHPNNNTSKFDLSMEVIPMNNLYTLKFEYCTKLFDECFVKQFSSHYTNILNSVLNNTNIKISDINILSEEEKNKILYDFNGKKVDYPNDKTIADLFEQQVEKTPDNIAVVFGSEQLTFKELNEKANSLAHYLKTNINIGRNDIVGIMASRSLEIIVAILASIKAGAAYIPIDPTFPQDRVEFMLNNSNAKILLTQDKWIDKIKFNKKIHIDLNTNNIVYNCSKQNPERINKPEDLVYVIYTSGSTGKPKGVMVTHKVLSNFTNYCNNYVDYLKNPTYLTIASITTISFDIFAYETLISLQKGLKVVIANENEQTTPSLLNQLMKKHNVSILQSTPSVMQIFIDNINNMDALKKLKYVILAGEQLPLNLVHTLHSFGNITVYNGYGPSETYYSSLTKMNDDLITIGKSIYNSQMYILDKNLNIVPIGVIGEIYISGDCVGKGYLNNPDLTSKSFIPDPYSPNTIMYKSGDLGYHTRSGDIVCLGRSDHQIKIRGLRIELGEIESLMLNYPHIHKVAVVKQSVQSREFISAYFVANKRISTNELRKYLLGHLPKYMVPSYFIPLDDLPYTPNGKIDRKSLPIPTDIISMSSEKYIAPTTEIQKLLVNLEEKILNIKPIGINDNFFELGGDSILAMNLNIELLKIYSNITYSDIFHFPTIAKLEEKITSEQDNPMFNKIENLPDSFADILNDSKKKTKLKNWHPRNILLTGSTGFLGIHILEEFIKNENGKIFCIIRNEPGITAKQKISQKLHYYFGNVYDYLIDTRIITLVGNICEPNFGLSPEDLSKVTENVDIVINSAANVAHFGNYNNFYNTNVKSVKYIIDFCKNFDKKLYQISTTGIAGSKLDSSSPLYNKKRCPSNNKKNIIKFDESNLYIGQTLENVYERTKFDAESCVLSAINNGIDAYIVRVGNLMPRYRDYMFQENILENAFINRLATFTKIGAIPNNILDYSLEFTPVDCASNAIYKIITHPTNINRIFHVYNHKKVHLTRLLKLLNINNYKIEILSPKNFEDKINNILKDENSKFILNNLASDFDNNQHLDYNNDIILNSNFSIKYLRRSNFKWHKITNKYLTEFINLLRKVI